MIITQKDILKKFKSHLYSKFPNDFILSIKSLSCDFIVLRMGCDELYKVIYEDSSINKSSIETFIKNSSLYSSFITKKYFLVYVSSDLKFTFKQII